MARVLGEDFGDCELDGFGGAFFGRVELRGVEGSRGGGLVRWKLDDNI